MSTIKFTAYLVLFLSTCLFANPSDPEDPLNRPRGKERPRVLISSDIGGDDEDDMQSFVRYLIYADMFETVGLVASPPRAGRKQDFINMIDIYAKDYDNLKTWSWYPEPDSLKAVTKQGALNAGAPGEGKNTEGSDHIITEAQKDDDRPLWILVWGSITDVAQALYDEPTIKSKIRIHSISSWNVTVGDKASYDYIIDNHKDSVWWIDNWVTFRGIYQEGNTSGDYNSRTFISNSIAPYGYLGDFYKGLYDGALIKEGDTPTLLYLLFPLLDSSGNGDDPTLENWGGQYKKTGGTYWEDLYPESDNTNNPIAKRTVAKWREQWQDHFAYRMKWTESTNPDTLPVATWFPGSTHITSPGNQPYIQRYNNKTGILFNNKWFNIQGKPIPKEKFLLLQTPGGPGNN
ncbi:MAG: DUF1593 domain-containing protein [Fibrobacteria bacterium]|nr:DUF1593 domain-containing protein [Fibrobacteria bacterium]